jgi:hypothetical protein
MEDLSQDFDVLAERADHCGALWAARVMGRLVSAQCDIPAKWPGTVDEARRLVETFAGRSSHPNREQLTFLVQFAATWTWADSLLLVGETARARAS